MRYITLSSVLFASVFGPEDSSWNQLTPRLCAKLGKVATLDKVSSQTDGEILDNDMV